MGKKREKSSLLVQLFEMKRDNQCAVFQVLIVCLKEI
jgi:hypothetical protein